MEIIIFLIVVFAIYSWGKSSGFKEGNRRGSQAGYQAGRLDAASKVSVKGGGGCMSILIVLSTLFYAFY